MNPEQQQIAIAKACNWTHYHEDLWVPPNTKDFSELDCTNLPNYLSDLNAMHEAEKVLKSYDKGHTQFYAGSLTHYRNVLWRLTDNDYVSATAPQRAEAFLKTLNLWKD